MMETQGWKVKVSGEGKRWLVPMGKESGAEGECQPAWAQTSLLSRCNTAQAVAAHQRRRAAQASGHSSVMDLTFDFSYSAL